MILGQLYIISAPSGAGKTSLVTKLIDSVPGLCSSVSYTTRAPRPGEKNGVDYHFIDQESYDRMVESKEFVEYARVFDYGYGTRELDLRSKMSQGFDMVLEIDWQGARQIREVFPDSTSIFILPPSRMALEKRLKERGQDDAAIIERRMAKAVAEMEHYNEFDYLVINDDFNEACLQLKSIVLAGRARQKLQKERYKAIIDELLM